VRGAIPIADNVFWVGANDRETDLFERKSKSCFDMDIKKTIAIIVSDYLAG
jgi:hypothetical protein